MRSQYGEFGQRFNELALITQIRRSTETDLL